MADPSVEVKYDLVHTVAGEFTFTATVLSSVVIEPEIFVFQYDPIELTSEFYTIANPAEMLGYPKTTPGTGSSFYRLATVSIPCETAEEMLDTKTEFETDIQLLVDNWTLIDGDINQTETVTYTPSS